MAVSTIVVSGCIERVELLSSIKIWYLKSAGKWEILFTISTTIACGFGDDGNLYVIANSNLNMFFLICHPQQTLHRPFCGPSWTDPSHTNCGPFYAFGTCSAFQHSDSRSNIYHFLVSAVVFCMKSHRYSRNKHCEKNTGVKATAAMCWYEKTSNLELSDRNITHELTSCR